MFKKESFYGFSKQTISSIIINFTKKTPLNEIIPKIDKNLSFSEKLINKDEKDNINPLDKLNFYIRKLNFKLLVFNFFFFK